MNATEFIKENYTLTNGGEDYICNHSGQLVGAEDISEAYHEYKLKLLGISGVVGRSEQLKAFVDWWHGLSQEELVWYDGRYVEVFLSL